MPVPVSLLRGEDLQEGRQLDQVSDVWSLPFAAQSILPPQPAHLQFRRTMPLFVGA
jgi:hypothetical protein